MTRASTIAFTPRNRLSGILAGADRKTFADHVSSAEQAVQAIAPRLIESLDDEVRALAVLCRQDETETFARCREIGWLALSIVESARLAGRPGLASAAKGVWEMIDALSARGVWHTDALRVHADALTMLAVVEEGPEAAAMTRALSRLRETIGAAATP
jgi:hypothetical protein